MGGGWERVHTTTPPPPPFWWVGAPTIPPPVHQAFPCLQVFRFSGQFFSLRPQEEGPPTSLVGGIDPPPCRPSCAALVEIEKIVEVERRVEVPFDTIVEVERVVEVEKIVEIPIEVVKNAAGPPCAHVRN